MFWIKTLKTNSGPRGGWRWQDNQSWLTYQKISMHLSVVKFHSLLSHLWKKKKYIFYEDLCSKRRLRSFFPLCMLSTLIWRCLLCYFDVNSEYWWNRVYKISTQVKVSHGNRIQLALPHTKCCSSSISKEYRLGLRKQIVLYEIYIHTLKQL